MKIYQKSVQFSNLIAFKKKHFKPLDPSVGGTPNRNINSNTPPIIFRRYYKNEFINIKI